MSDPREALDPAAKPQAPDEWAIRYDGPTRRPTKLRVRYADGTERIVYMEPGDTMSSEGVVSVEGEV